MASRTKKPKANVAAYHSKTIRDIDMVNPPKKEWLINGIAPLGGVTFVWGDTDAGKTTFTLQSAKSVITETPLELPGHEARKGEVLYLGLEKDEDTLLERTRDIFGVWPLPVEFHWFIATGLNWKQADIEAWLEQELNNHPDIKLVIIDHLGANERITTARCLSLHALATEET
jgi:hypothetical protein